MKNAVLIISALFFVFFVSCRKEKLEDFNPEFNGLWASDTILLSSGGAVQNFLNVNGKESWYGQLCVPGCAVVCSCQIRNDGKAKIDKKKRVYIGWTYIKGLVVTREPYRDARGKMICELGNKKYYRQ